MPRFTGIRPSPSIALRKCTSTEITPSTGGIYDQYDLLGSALKFTDVAGYPYGTGVIRRVQLTDLANKIGLTTIVFMSVASSTSLDGEAFTIPDANLNDVIAPVSFASSDTHSFNNNNTIYSVDVNIPFISDSNNEIYAYPMLLNGEGTSLEGTTGYVIIWTDPQR